jgi:lipopolysaccharide/colanic/teichoic acid biosynthesis glycosyltransferase
MTSKELEASGLAVTNVADQCQSADQRLGKRLLGKRLLDLAIAIPALIASLPILLPAMLLMQLADPGSVLFRQIRIGRGECPFTMLKLRTMRLGSDDNALREFNTRELRGEPVPTSDGIFKLENDPRLLPMSWFLRRFSIDELPQLVNVILGDMSIVGPRPCLPWEVELFTPQQRRRHEVLPGITGLWQVSGRNRLTMQQMLALDLVYIDRQSFLFDLKILWQTVPAVLLGHTR